MQNVPLHPSHRSPWARDRYLLWTGVVNGLCKLCGADRMGSWLRRALLRRYGWQIAPGAQIDGIGYAYGQVHIGTGTYINRGSYFEGEALITIGEGVSLGPSITFLTVSHQPGPPTHRAGVFAIAPITVGDGAWIGARAVILPGVQIGAGAVVAAGAVVTADVPAHTLVAGVPAVVKKHLDEA